MIGATPLERGIAYANFNTFEKNFPYEQKRIAFAKNFIPNGDRAIPEITHPTQSILAALWGDEAKTRQEAAFYLYDVKSTVSNNIGKAVLSIAGCSVLDLNNSGQSLPNIFIETGYVADDSLIYEFSQPKSPRQRGDKRPYLGFRVGIPIMHGHTIVTDSLGEPTVVPQSTNAEKVLPIYSGQILLAWDKEDYEVSRKSVTKPELIFGTAAASNLLDKIGLLAPLYE